MFAEKLKKLRKSKEGLSQAKLADALGVTQQAVGRWEKDLNMPDHDIMVKIADFFKVSIDYLEGRADTHGYYVDEETAKIANEMKENPGRRVLFDATRNLSPEKIKQVKDFVDFITRED